MSYEIRFGHDCVAVDLSKRGAWANVARSSSLKCRSHMLCNRCQWTLPRGRYGASSNFPYKSNPNMYILLCWRRYTLLKSETAMEERGRRLDWVPWREDAVHIDRVAYLLKGHSHKILPSIMLVRSRRLDYLKSFCSIFYQKNMNAYN